MRGWCAATPQAPKVLGMSTPPGSVRSTGATAGPPARLHHGAARTDVGVVAGAAVLALVLGAAPSRRRAD